MFLIIILQLRKEIPFSAKVAAVKLPDPNYVLPDNQEITAIGWGDASPAGASAILQEVTLTAVTNEGCRGLLLGHEVPDFILCGHSKEAKGTCFGDSGGPGLLADGTQVGVIAFLRKDTNGPCANPEAPSGFVRLTTFVKSIEGVTGLLRNTDGYLKKKEVPV